MLQLESGSGRGRARRRALRVLIAAAIAAALSASLTTPADAADDAAAYRYSAPIVVEQSAAFVQLPLPPSVYGRSELPELRDLRIIDASGNRVPFAVLTARPAAVVAGEHVREATLYPLPTRPAGSAAWPSPVDVVVEGDRISVSRHAPGGKPTASRTTAGTPSARAASPDGWLIDTGATARGEPRPASLRLRWSGLAEFSAGFDLESSDDLRSWRRSGGGQIMALQSAAGALTQPLVMLEGGAGRFVRLAWSDAATAPALTGAEVQIPEPALVASEASRELAFAASPEPPGRAGLDALAARAAYFDLGGALPLVDVDLRFSQGTHVAPVRLQGRLRTDEAWRDIGAGVFYRLERGGGVAESPAVALPATVRFLRVVADERAAALEPAQLRLYVHASLATLVFAAQGTPPFRLLAGDPAAAAGALPVGTLVPRLDDERARLGHATLGDFGEVAAVALQAEKAAQQARLRPWLLWAVLIIGVLGLGALVWRLSRAGGAPPAVPPGEPGA